MIIDPANISRYTAYDLLNGAARGLVGLDRRWLHALVDDPDKTLPDILRFGSEDIFEYPVLLEQDLVSIFEYLKTPLGFPFLLGAIRRDPEDIQDEVVEAFVHIGARSIEPLLELYHELEEDKAGEVAFLLAGLNVNDPRILDLLLSRLDEYWDDALFHLEVYGDPAAIPALEKRLESTVLEEQRLDIADTIEDLRKPKPDVKLEPFDIWDLYPAEAGPEFEVLSEEQRIELLAAENADLRAQTATSFFGEEFSTEASAKLLQIAREDPEPEVRACAWEDFIDLAGSKPELRASMMERLKDPATPDVERAGLALGLARHTDQPAVRNAILQLAKDPETRERAVEAMWRSFDPQFGPEVSQYLDDPDLEVRRNAIWGIGYLEVKADAGLLRKFFDDDELRPDALHNYALSAPGQTTRKKMEALFEKITEIAKGLTLGESDIVKAGLDVRLVRAGLEPYFKKDDGEENIEEPPPVAAVKAGRNDPCPCGSGKKFKKCCGA